MKSCNRRREVFINVLERRVFYFGLEWKHFTFFGDLVIFLTSRPTLTFHMQAAVSQRRRDFNQRDLNRRRPNHQSAAAKPVHETFEDTFTLLSNTFRDTHLLLCQSECSNKGSRKQLIRKKGDLSDVERDFRGQWWEWTDLRWNDSET